MNEDRQAKVTKATHYSSDTFDPKDLHRGCRARHRNFRSAALAWCTNARVPHYIVGQDGRPLGRTEFFCADDEAAKERDRQLVDGNDVELWRHDRKIAELKGRRTSDSTIRCPRTGLNVSRPLVPDPEADPIAYDYVPCPACGLSHLVNKSTGKLIADKS